MSKRESEIERELVHRVRDRGGLALKFISSVSGVPDRIVIMRGHTFFVELKSERGKLSPLQKAMIRRMRNAGAEVHVVHSIAQIEDLLP